MPIDVNAALMNLYKQADDRRKQRLYEKPLNTPSDALQMGNLLARVAGDVFALRDRQKAERAITASRNQSAESKARQTSFDNALNMYRAGIQVPQDMAEAAGVAGLAKMTPPVKAQKKTPAPHYGPVYGRGDKYYQSIFQADESGNITPQEIALGGEPMQIMAQKQAVLSRYTDDDRAAVEAEYKRLKDYAGVQAEAYSRRPSQYAEAYNQAMQSGISRMKNARLKQAIEGLWNAETTPAVGNGLNSGIGPSQWYK